MAKLIEKRINSKNEIDEIYQIVAHTFFVFDSEDPVVGAAEPLWNWQQSDPGKFIMKNAIEPPQWQKHLDPSAYRYQFAIIAKLEKKKLSEFYLRFGKSI